MWFMSGRTCAETRRRASLVAVVFLGGAFLFASAGAAADAPPAGHVVTGTLAMLDIAKGKGMLTTDLGKPIFFHIDRPEQFTRLSIGERVTVQLDEDGRILKIIEATPAEMHEAPPAPMP